MFGKTRTLAVAIAAAGLIGSWAPMASAATAQGPGGTNVGGLVNLSNNQIPLQLCNNNIPVNVLGLQVPLNNVTAALGLGTDGPTEANSDSSCHQASAQRDGAAEEGLGAGFESGARVPFGDEGRFARFREVPFGEERFGECSRCAEERGEIGFQRARHDCQCRVDRSVGLAGTEAVGARLARSQEGPGDDTNIGGLANVSDNQIPVQVCNNNIPVNALGVQVPVNDVTAALGLGSEGDTMSNADRSCHQTSSQGD